MRKIGYKKWLQNVQRGSNLTQDEQQELFKWVRAQTQGPQTWEEYESIAAHIGELIAKANGCLCLDDIRNQYRQVVENFRIASKGNLKLLQDINHLSHKEHWKMNTKLARQFARQRRCHGLMRGFICYCDEHKH